MELISHSQALSEALSFVGSAKKPLITVLGPTAGGKTGFSLEIARALAAGGHTCEVVNVDSRQMYKFLDIGTAKVTPEEAGDVPHHLIDVLDPSEELTVAWYQERAMRIIAEIHACGHVPLLVGGSMLYISAVIDGFSLPPAADPAIRERLTEEYEADPVALYERLRSVDPVSAERIHPNNAPYVIRALEMYEATGKPASTLKEEKGSPYDLLLFGMHWPREDLYARIDQRTTQLLQHGWIAEVIDLRRQGCTAETPAMKSHGYREILAALETGADPEVLKKDPAFAESISVQVRRYAKRQTTWWRNDERIRWIAS